MLKNLKEKLKNSKKVKKYLLVVLVILIIILTILGGIIAVKFYKLRERKNVLEDETVLNVITFDEEETDENVIGYLTIEAIGLKNAPIAEGTEMSVLNNYLRSFF